MIKIILICAVAFSYPTHSFAKATTPSKAPYNDLVLQIVQKMPSYGGYSVDKTAFNNLQKSITIQKESLEVQPKTAHPSFCSGSTYLVFTQVLVELQKNGKLSLTASDWKDFLVANPSQEDGEGVWGRWNANGPGTARLFHELRLGKNFTRLDDAVPGDFLKIFWSKDIGAKEKGHSVIFTGIKNEADGRKICYWSSNQPYEGEPQGGMGVKCSDEKKIHRMLFSRLETPEALKSSLKEISGQSKKYSDSYLSSLLKVESNLEEMCNKVQCLK